ncbi:MAG: haloacid dehalogenase-like hydrolase, partial [Bacteroidales bacterium]|nr:haloacid dehalogenase-like hydrolase [Bacteroidales bacterium]
MKKKPIVALIYDFDGTLSPGNMQEFGFIQAVGSTPDEFWKMSDNIAIGQDASNVLSYMKLMFDEAHSKGISLKRDDLRRFGAGIELFEGVRGWFELVNKYGREH